MNTSGTGQKQLPIVYNYRSWLRKKLTLWTAAAFLSRSARQ